MGEAYADAMCYIVLEKSFPLNLLLELDVSSFMVLLEFLEEQAKRQEREAKKAKKGRR